MLGLGSYAFRWSIGHKDLFPETPMTHIDLLKVAAEHELGLVQFADNIPLNPLSDAERRDLAACARDLGIAVELGTQTFDADDIALYIGFAEELDAQILRVALDASDAQVPVPSLAKAFRDLLPRAKAAGVRIAVENHFNYPSDRLSQLMEEIGDPSVGVCLDVANSICAGEWPMETVRKLAPFAINLHLKDYDIIPEAYGVGFTVTGTPLGQGRSDCRAVLDALPKDRDVNVIIEHWLPKADDMEAVKAREHVWLDQSLGYARDTLAL